MSAERDELERLSRRAAGGDAAAARRLADLLEARSGSQPPPRPTGVWVRFYGRELGTERRTRSRDLPREDLVKSLTLGPFHRIVPGEDYISGDSMTLATRPISRGGPGYWRVNLEWAARAPETAGIRLPDEGPMTTREDVARRRHFAFVAHELLSSPRLGATGGREESGGVVEVILLPSLAETAAAEIVVERGGGTSDMEVVREVVRMAGGRGLGVRLVRREPRGDVTFEGDEVDVALERGIEIRPVR